MRKKINPSETILLLSAICLILFSGCEKKSPPKTSTAFRPPGGNFSINMPGTPVESSHITRTENGNILYSSYNLDAGDAWYGVQYSEYPQGHMDDRSPDEMLRGAIRACEMGFEAKLTGKTEILLGEYPGQEVTFKQSGGLIVIKSRLFLVRDRLYQVTARVANTEKGLKQAQEYLDSFQVRHD